MGISPNSQRVWFEFLPVALKAWIILAFPVVMFCVRRFDADPFPAFLVLSEQKQVLAPVLTSYYFACALLSGIGIVELERHRHKQAMWDFAFALLALFLVVVLNGFQHSQVK